MLKLYFLVHVVCEAFFSSYVFPLCTNILLINSSVHFWNISSMCFSIAQLPPQAPFHSSHTHTNQHFPAATTAGDTARTRRHVSTFKPGGTLTVWLAVRRSCAVNTRVLPCVGHTQSQLGGQTMHDFWKNTGACVCLRGQYPVGGAECRGRGRVKGRGSLFTDPLLHRHTTGLAKLNQNWCAWQAWRGRTSSSFAYSRLFLELNKCALSCVSAAGFGENQAPGFGKKTGAGVSE